MNDSGTMCKCGKPSNGDEYCRKCDADIAARERADDERGFSLPVKVSETSGDVIVDADGLGILHIWPDVKDDELAQVIADEINAHYSDEKEGA